MVPAIYDKVLKNHYFLSPSLNGLCLFATRSSDCIVHTIIPSSPYYHTWDWVCWVLLIHPFTIITGKTWPWKCDSFGKWIMFVCSPIIIRLHYIEKGLSIPSFTITHHKLYPWQLLSNYPFWDFKDKRIVWFLSIHWKNIGSCLVNNVNNVGCQQCWMLTQHPFIDV